MGEENIMSFGKSTPVFAFSCMDIIGDIIALVSSVFYMRN